MRHAGALEQTHSDEACKQAGRAWQNCQPPVVSKHTEHRAPVFRWSMIPEREKPSRQGVYFTLCAQPELDQPHGAAAGAKT
jgi:hypothetical protein